MTDELRAKFDPNPMSSGPTKWRAENCATHHYACDCREWEHACEVEQLEAEVAALKAEIEGLRKDAERYRWLRNVAWSLPAVPQEELPACAVFSGSGRRCKDISGAEMDQAIDTAMQEGGK